MLTAGIIFLVIPFILDSVFGEGLTRASVTIFAQSNSISEIMVLLWQNSMAHIDPRFLLFGKADSIRHSIGTMGVFYPTTVLFILFGILRGLTSCISKHNQNTTFRFFWLFAIGWIVVGLAPAIIGMEVPHPNRALLSLPGFLLVAVLGIDQVARFVHQHSKSFRFFSSISVLFFVLLELAQLSVFLSRYFDSYAKESSPLFQDGYDEVFAEVWLYYDGIDTHSPIDQFVITSEYGQPYIYALMSRKVTTYEYHNGALINFLFPDVVQLSDLDRPNALVVAGEKSDLIDKTKASKVIYSKDGKPRFWIFDTNTL